MKPVKIPERLALEQGYTRVVGQQEDRKDQLTHAFPSHDQACARLCLENFGSRPWMCS